MEQIKVTVSKAVDKDVIHVANRLRQEDIDFCKRFMPDGAKKTLVSSYNNSQNTWCLKMDGEPVVIFGVVQEETMGYSWMGTTDRITEAPLQVAKISRVFAGLFKETCKKVVGFVDAKHLTSIKWHKFMGYKLHQHKSDKGLPYYVATLEA